MGEIIKAVENTGYMVSISKAANIELKEESKKTKGTNQIDTVKFIGLAVIVLSVYVIINNTIGFDFIIEIGQAMSYTILFIVGLLGLVLIIPTYELMKSLNKILCEFLRKMADQNQKQFGNEKLDCCSLERPKLNSK